MGPTGPRRNDLSCDVAIIGGVIGGLRLPAALLSDLNMLVFTGGQERTNTEYGQLLAAAGLSLANVQPVAAPYGVIEGYPA